MTASDTPPTCSQGSVSRFPAHSLERMNLAMQVPCQGRCTAPGRRVGRRQARHLCQAAKTIYQPASQWGQPGADAVPERSAGVTSTSGRGDSGWFFSKKGQQEWVSATACDTAGMLHVGSVSQEVVSPPRPSAAWACCARLSGCPAADAMHICAAAHSACRLLSLESWVQNLFSVVGTHKS